MLLCHLSEAVAAPLSRGDSPKQGDPAAAGPWLQRDPIFQQAASRMFLLKQILPAAIMAMMVAAGVCGLALYWGKERARGAVGPLALGLAYLSGHLVITGWVPFPPADTTNWLPYFALAAAVLASLFSAASLFPEGGASARPGREKAGPSETEARRGRVSDGALKLPAWARVLIFSLVSAGALRLLLQPKFSYGWSLTDGCIWVACLAGAMVLLAIILDALARRPATAVEMPAFLLITCAGTVGALMLSGSMLLGQFAVVLGAAVFGSLVLTARKVALGRGIVPVFTLLLVPLLLSGYFFAELPASSAALIAFAPVLALIPIRMRAIPTFPVRAALMSVPILVALVLAFRSSPPLSY